MSLADSGCGHGHDHRHHHSHSDSTGGAHDNEEHLRTELLNSFEGLLHKIESEYSRAGAEPSLLEEYRKVSYQALELSRHYVCENWFLAKVKHVLAHLKPTELSSHILNSFYQLHQFAPGLAHFFVLTEVTMQVGLPLLGFATGHYEAAGVALVHPEELAVPALYLFFKGFISGPLRNARMADPTRFFGDRALFRVLNERRESRRVTDMSRWVSQQMLQAGWGIGGAQIPVQVVKSRLPQESLPLRVLSKVFTHYGERPKGYGVSFTTNELRHFLARGEQDEAQKIYEWSGRDYRRYAALLMARVVDDADSWVPFQIEVLRRYVGNFLDERIPQHAQAKLSSEENEFYKTVSEILRKRAVDFESHKEILTQFFVLYRFRAVAPQYLLTSEFWEHFVARSKLPKGVSSSEWFRRVIEIGKAVFGAQFWPLNQRIVHQGKVLVEVHGMNGDSISVLSQSTAQDLSIRTIDYLKSFEPAFESRSLPDAVRLNVRGVFPISRFQAFLSDQLGPETIEASLVAYRERMSDLYQSVDELLFEGLEKAESRYMYRVFGQNKDVVEGRVQILKNTWAEAFAVLKEIEEEGVRLILDLHRDPVESETYESRIHAESVERRWRRLLGRMQQLVSGLEEISKLPAEAEFFESRRDDRPELAEKVANILHFNRYVENRIQLSPFNPRRFVLRCQGLLSL